MSTEVCKPSVCGNTGSAEICEHSEAVFEVLQSIQDALVSPQFQGQYVAFQGPGRHH